MMLRCPSEGVMSSPPLIGLYDGRQDINNDRDRFGRIVFPRVVPERVGKKPAPTKGFLSLKVWITSSQ